MLYNYRCFALAGGHNLYFGDIPVSVEGVSPKPSEQSG